MTIQEKYLKHIKGEISKEKFLYETRRDPNLTQFVTNMTSYNDAISILRNRGIITEATKKVEALTLDTANPYEVRKGIDIELELCYKPSIRIEGAELIKVQNKVLKNLAKDPNFYSKTYGGIKPTSKPDLASDVPFGSKSKRSDVPILVKNNNFKETRKGNISTVVEKDVKSNVKDTLGNKEKAKQKNPKGVKLMSIIPSKQKGVKVMALPGKEKKIKLHEESSKLKSIVRKIASSFQDGRSTTLNQNITLEENIPASTSNMIPFANVRPGMTAVDDSGERFKILAMGNYAAVRRYDSSGVFNKFLSSDPTGIDATQLVGLIDQDGNTFVRVYGTGGVYVFKGGAQEAIVVKPNSPEADPNNLKKYTDKGLDIKLDTSTNMHENYLGEEFEDEIQKKQVPHDEIEQAEAKAAILVTLTKANLKNVVKETKIVKDHIWVRIGVGHGYLDAEQLKALAGDSKFAGLNPISNTDISLIFKKS